MLILVLMDVQHSHNAIFSFEKGLNHQNHSPSSGSHYPVKQFSPAKFLIPSTHWEGNLPHPTTPLTTNWKTLYFTNPFCFMGKFWKFSLFWTNLKNSNSLSIFKGGFQLWLKSMNYCLFHFWINLHFVF